MDIRDTCVAVVALIATASALHADQGRELVRDRHFLRGFTVYDPAPGKHVERGVLQWEECLGDPIWGLAQWHSRTSIVGAQGERLDSGAVRFATDTKTVTVARPGSKGADVSLAVDALHEYPDGPRKKGQDWPHLLMSQRFARCPSVTEMEQLRFHIEVRLKHSKRYDMEGYSQNLHAAQFLTTITVQNLNRGSEGYGDFLWLVLPQYDDRRRITLPFMAPDQAMSKFIYTPPGEQLTDRSTHDRDWVAYDLDILPIVKTALERAWERGYLLDSRDLGDYRLGGISVGWEVPGTLSVEVQARNLSLRVRTMPD